jgi:type IV pilus assembly protein PilN
VIRINLLPHRELKRTARRREFALMAAGAAVVGLAVWWTVHTVIDGMIGRQEARNQLLKTEIAALDKQIEEIRKLREQTQALVARKQVVETLQSNRTEVVRLLDQLVRQMPDGVFLKAVKQTGRRVNVSGYAQSSARVSTFMRNIEGSPWIGEPELVEIKAVQLNNQRVNEFSLNVAIKQPVIEGQEAPVKPAPGKAAPGKAAPGKAAPAKAAPAKAGLDPEDPKA